MGTCLLTFHSAGQIGIGDGGLPVARLDGAVTEKLTSGASSVQSASVAGGTGLPQGASNRKSDGGFVTVTPQAVNVYVAVGANPTAALPSGSPLKTSAFPVLSNQPITFALAKGDKVAVIEFT